MEQLLFFIIFALIGIGQFLFRWFSARKQQEEEESKQRRTPVPVPAPRPGRDRKEEWDEERQWEEKLRREAAERPRREAARSAPPPFVVRAQEAPAAPARASVPPVRRPATSSRRLVLHSELRRAIVLMEILGTCRGVRPMTPPRGD